MRVLFQARHARLACAVTPFMSEIELRFSPSCEQDAGAFRLIELPPELCKLIDSVVKNKPSEPM